MNQGRACISTLITCCELSNWMNFQPSSFVIGASGSSPLTIFEKNRRSSMHSLLRLERRASRVRAPCNPDTSSIRTVRSDQDEDQCCWPAPTVSPSVPRAVLHDDVARLERDHLFIVEFKRDLTFHQDAVIYGIGRMHPRTFGLEPFREARHRDMYSAPAAAGLKSDDIITESGGNVTIISRVSPTSGRTLLRSSATLRPSHGTDGVAAVPQIRAG